MLKLEQNYDFRKRMCTLHHKVKWDKTVLPKADEYALPETLTISIDFDSVVAENAIKDFKDYLRVAFGIKAKFVKNAQFAEIKGTITDKNLGQANGYMGRKRTTTKDGILIEAYDDRGFQQALFSMETELNDKKAPYVTHGVLEQRAKFTPRMIHSGYGCDEYPDEYLNVCAHYGYDAILLFVKDSKHTTCGECDFSDIINRAKNYGIDTYAYSYLKNFNHPLDEGAKETYDSIYGPVFREHPGFKGIVFVGESIEFPSRDPHVSPRHYYDKPADNIPESMEKHSPGWYPCYDFKEWLELVRDTIRAIKPDADIVFWTYNFGYVEEEARIKLLKTLPTDVSLQVTFEMFERRKIGNALEIIMDYTASFAGPGKYFTSEAKIAKERNIRLYSMVNTAGRTWDFGTIPYEPFPYQWQKRLDAILESQEKYGLCGLMEGHHYGFYPSIIARQVKNAYTVGGHSAEEELDLIARNLSETEPEKVKEVFKLWSEGITYYNATDEDQYGPCRVGPAYPMCLIKDVKLPKPPEAHFGSGIWNGLYKIEDLGRASTYMLRAPEEIKGFKKMLALMEQGLKIAKSIKNKNDELLRFINLGEYIRRSIITTLNAKKLYDLRIQLLNARTKEKTLSLCDKIEKLARDEIKNAEAAIPLVRRDSMLGYEPSMLYQSDEKAILWKIKQVNYMIDVELDMYRKGAKY